MGCGFCPVFSFFGVDEWAGIAPDPCHDLFLVEEGLAVGVGRLGLRTFPAECFEGTDSFGTDFRSTGLGAGRNFFGCGTCSESHGNLHASRGRELKNYS